MYKRQVLRRGAVVRVGLDVADRARRAHGDARVRDGADVAGGADRADAAACAEATRAFVGAVAHARVAVRAARAVGDVEADAYDGAPAEDGAFGVSAPPGPLGILFGNDALGHWVTGVRATSPLHGALAPGARIVSVDGEDTRLASHSELVAVLSAVSYTHLTLPTKA